MRTTKRFTPAVLDRFRRQGRGLGTYSDYVPWHQISRGDPSSKGRSHLTMYEGRYRELLSDGEQTALFFALMTMSERDDIREQLPLSTEASKHEVARYDIRLPTDLYPGTLEIAGEIGFKHPVTTEGDETEEWVMSTDLVITYRNNTEHPKLLAVSVKPSPELSKVTKRRLQIEQRYWAAREIEFLLITPNEYDPRIKKLLSRTKPWALAAPVPDHQLLKAASVIIENQSVSYTDLIAEVSKHTGDDEIAKRAIWQAVWLGHCPVDLRMGWRPHLPLTLMTDKEFSELNPIASRRSASWT